jgi:hypothetical protein
MCTLYSVLVIQALCMIMGIFFLKKMMIIYFMPSKMVLPPY